MTVQNLDQWRYKPVCGWCKRSTESTYSCESTAKIAARLLGWRQGLCVECQRVNEEKTR